MWKGLSFTALWLSIGVTRLGAAGVVVNEYHNGSGTVTSSPSMVSDEFIEFAITERMSAAALAALSFGDSNQSTNTLQSSFQFDLNTLNSVLSSAGLSEFLPGTLIVVMGSGFGSQDLAYNPLATNTLSDSAWNLQLVVGQGVVDHPTAPVNSDINISDSGDLVWISTSNPVANNHDTTGFLSALGHTSGNPGHIADDVVAMFGAGSMLQSAVAAGSNVANAGDMTTVVATSTTVSTLGAANGGSNSDAILALRNSNFIPAIPEPSRALLMVFGLAFVVLRRTRSTLEPQS